MSDNLLLKIIDEAIDEQSTYIPFAENEFTIDSDSKAEWAMRKIAEERAETQRYVNVCQTMINEYQEKIRKAQEQENNKTAFLKTQLQSYFQSVDRKKTKTQDTYKLPGGTLILKYQNPNL